MSSILSGIADLGDRFLLGYAIGAAAGPALEPFSQELANLAWKVNDVKPPTIYTLVQGVAQGQIDPAQALEWSQEQGFSETAFNALRAAADNGPALGLAYESLRRGDLTPEQFVTVMTRHAIEPAWFPSLLKLKDQPLEPAEIAKAIHRGIMRNDGLLIAVPPTTPGKVPAVPPSDLDPITEAEWSGMDRERLRILTGNAGLPPGIVQMLQLLNRGEITADDFLRGVGESNLRNEWGQAMLALRRHLLTPHEYAEAELRGVLQPGDAQAGAGLSGLEPADYATLFAILGRPLNIHQITTGLARGGHYGGTYDDVPAGPYRDAIRRSAVRPEYASLDYANRYTYPSGFQIKSEAAELGYDTTHSLLLEIGWNPKWADFFAQKWTGGTAGTKADTHITKAQTQLWNTTHGSYKAFEVSAQVATTALETAGVDAAAIPQVLSIWNAERTLIRAQLSAKEIAKAYSEQVTNPATGAPWTLQDAIARLLELGYTQADATTLLEL